MRRGCAAGIKALTDFPDQRDWLTADLPGRMPSAVEEIVRWARPIMTSAAPRPGTATCEVSASKRVPTGVLVVLDPHAGEHPRELALEAAAACPAQSLRVY